MDEIRVRPIKSPLTDSGTVWESQLWKRGWNELPEEQKFGIVKRGWEDYCIEVYFPYALLSALVYTDEVVRYEG